jgi:hypothetical protein
VKDNPGDGSSQRAPADAGIFNLLRCEWKCAVATTLAIVLISDIRIATYALELDRSEHYSFEK